MLGARARLRDWVRLERKLCRPEATVRFRPSPPTTYVDLAFWARGEDRPSPLIGTANLVGLFECLFRLYIDRVRIEW